MHDSLNLDRRIRNAASLGCGIPNIIISANKSVFILAGYEDAVGDAVFVPSNYVLSSQVTTSLSDIREEAKRKLDLTNHFDALASQWKKERGISSSLSKAILCPSYQKIIGMGPDVIPIILDRIRDEGEHPNYWFWALESLTGENPVSEDDLGDFRAMASAWLSWGYKNGKLAAR